MIGMYGIGGLYNFGCEAIVRGTYNYIKQFYRNEDIIYFSNNYKYDKEKLIDLDILIIDVRKKFPLIRKLINRILAKIGIRHRIILDDWNTIFKNVDCIYSIGGDMYTVPRRYWESNKFDFYNNLIEFGKVAEKRGKKIIVFGASVGPFGENVNANNYYISALRKVEHIYCREKKTMKFLEARGLDNCSFFPDPAFLVENTSSKQIIPKYIGINFSPLSLVEAFGNYNNENIRKFAKVIENLIDTINLPILLIPHVLANRNNDNDFVFLSRILKYIGNDYRKMVEIIDKDLGFIGTKDKLKECYIVVSARMHCCINAICEGVPAIFISYSQKSVGMGEYIYKTDEYIIDVSEIEDKLINVTLNLLQSYEKARVFIKNRLLEIKNEVR